MSLVVSKESSFFRRHAGVTGLMDPATADEQDIRPLHIGLVNIMPNVRATEDQLLLPLVSASATLQIVPHLISVPGVEGRSPEEEQHVKAEYEDVDSVLDEGLDGLIVTGANIAEADLRKASVWPALEDVFTAAENGGGEHGITSTLYLCLATHAYMDWKHGVRRTRLPEKRWGVFTHREIREDHPLVGEIGNPVELVHSRWNDVPRSEFETAGMDVLIAGDDAGVHMATSEDGIRAVCWQGHPEYQRRSLLGEFLRDASGYYKGTQDKLPPVPDGYFVGPDAVGVMEEFRAAVRGAKEDGAPFPRLDTDAVLADVNFRWPAVRSVLLTNWVNAVYNLTGVGRHDRLEEGRDPRDPFGLKREAEPAVSLS